MTNLSNSNTSNRNTPLNATIANNALLFKVGDRVLCPSLGLGLDTFTLQQSPHNKNVLMIVCHESNFYFDADGFTLLVGEPNTLDYAPSLFHDTPANRQAIATLYQCKSDVKVIDITQADDDEIVKVPSVLLSDIACDASTALETFNDVSTMLYMLINDDLKPHQIISFARLAYDSTSKRADAQLDVMNRLNQALTHSKFGAVEVSS